eukprot:1160919-Pelagomonas_calceolata.AAC.11
MPVANCASVSDVLNLAYLRCQAHTKKRITPNWSVLGECGQEPLQFCWFWAADRFYNTLLRSNGTLSKLLQADVGKNMSAGAQNPELHGWAWIKCNTFTQ